MTRIIFMLINIKRITKHFDENKGWNINQI